MAEKSESRVPLRVSYEHAPEGTRESAPGSDLSLGGVFIETTATLPVGALLSLEIESGTTKVALDARILSRRAAEGPDRPAGLAVSFIDLPNDVAASLHFIVATRTPRKGTMLGLGEAEDDIPVYQSEPRLPAARPLPNVEATPLARPPTPVMQTKAAEAPPSHVTAPGNPPSFQPPPAPAPASLPLAPPSAAPSWAPPSGPQAAQPWPAPTRPSGRIPVALVVAGVILLLLAVAAATWVLRGKLG